MLGLPTEVGNHEVTVKNRYEGVSNEELLMQLKTLTAKYKEKIKQSEVEPDL